jgi:predicted DCC family thiol-disulfide oxidoreductase YuxK
MTEGPVVVFDGYCVLCDGWVSFIMARDHRHLFRFAPLQGRAGQRLLNAAGPDAAGGESVVLVLDGRAYTKSTAALRIFGLLDYPWTLLQGLLIVPRVLRDAVYDLVARNRYAWFGRRTSCRLPSPQEQSLFLPD